MNKIKISIILLAVVIISACKSKVEEKVEEGKYTVTSPLLLDTFYTKDYIAQIQSIKNIEIRALEKGYLQSIGVDEGKSVKAGQMLFKIMPNAYEAELLKAQATAKEVEQEYLNTKTLFDKNIVSKAELAIAQAKYDEAKAEVSLAQLHLSFTEIKAPFSGVIDRIPLKLGSLIDEGALLTTLSDTSSVYAYFNVSESEYLSYKAQNNNDNKQITLILANGDEHKSKGIIETIEGQFDNETGNIAFRAKFPNPDLLLKHGETGKIRLTIPIKKALIIPQKCTYELQDKIYVYVVNNENKLVSRNVIIKQKLSNLYIIESGLMESDRILLDGLQTAKEDEKIEVDFIPAKKVMESLQLIKQ
jgi:membrane fusion protein (multidrug efflux system)